MVQHITVYTSRSGYTNMLCMVKFEIASSFHSSLSGSMLFDFDPDSDFDLDLDLDKTKK
jgi:hypothetical protein